ncbi:hypothetical protein SAMN05518855_1017140 [Paenibacillus sp. CF384]|nr:hypothetical protein SAMN05518855_1017140 [Paenibacillus sp. CF384]
MVHGWSRWKRDYVLSSNELIVKLRVTIPDSQQLIQSKVKLSVHKPHSQPPNHLQINHFIC